MFLIDWIFFFVVFIACECLNFVQGYPVTVYQFTETQKIVIIPFSAIYLSSRMKQTEKALYWCFDGTMFDYLYQSQILIATGGFELQPYSRPLQISKLPNF